MTAPADPGIPGNMGHRERIAEVRRVAHDPITAHNIAASLGVNAQYMGMFRDGLYGTTPADAAEAPAPP